MTEITQGVDCTRRLKKPRFRLRLEKRNIFAQPRELVILRLLEVPAECELSCYNWRHVRGGGYLDEDVGTAVRFTAPIDNEACKGSAIIKVYCGEKHLDTALVSTTTYATPGEILRWFYHNRTYPSPPFEYTKYYATVVRSMTVYERIRVKRPPLGDPAYTKPLLVPGQRYYDEYIKYGVATGDPLPEGIIREPRATWPRDWSPGDPTPEGFTIPPGTDFPEGWSYYITFPLKKHLYRCWRNYDCNGIYLNMWHYQHFGEGCTQSMFDRMTELLEGVPLVRDVRSRFLKGEKVKLEEGAVIPIGWKPNRRRLAGLYVPPGTIWPPDWRVGDPFPEWDCCPLQLLGAGLL